MFLKKRKAKYALRFFDFEKVVTNLLIPSLPDASFVSDDLRSHRCPPVLENESQDREHLARTPYNIRDYYGC